MDKKEARTIALSGRKFKDTKTASSIILDAILSSGALESFTRIGIYYPIGKEIDIMKLTELYPEKSFYLPVTKEEIAFVPYKTGDILVPGPFHTMEPEGEEVSRDSIECFLIPCVAVSKDKRRIGYGKGYYDRYLKGYTGKTIGILYKEDVYDCEGDSFDVMMSEILVG